MTGTRPLNVNTGIPKPNARRSGKIVASGNNGFTADGDTAVSSAGTLGNTFLSVSGDPVDSLTSMTSGAVLNNQAEVHGVALMRTLSPLRFEGYVRSGAVITVARVYAGVWNTATSTVLASDTPGVSGNFGFGFRRSTAAGDTNWKAVVSNGAADTVVDTGVVYAASTQYELAIVWLPGVSATFYINGVAVANITATLPSGVTLRTGAGIQTLEAVAKQFDCGWLYWEKD